MSVLYDKGTVKVTTKGSFFGRESSNLGWVSGEFNSSTEQKSKLASQLAPPKPKDVGRAYKFLSIGSLLGVALLSKILKLSRLENLILLGITIGMVIYFARQKRKVQHEYERQVYSPQKEKWNRSYMCHRCGEIYEVKPQKELDFNSLVYQKQISENR
ncbi:MAG TPA: hypothetical protein DCE56_13620 [Cyanobacteria bacterium UBA8553]|nr:hypothetical protein [Cyanobacteria bacterium UBA8553]